MVSTWGNVWNRLPVLLYVCTRTERLPKSHSPSVLPDKACIPGHVNLTWEQGPCVLRGTLLTGTSVRTPCWRFSNLKHASRNCEVLDQAAGCCCPEAVNVFILYLSPISHWRPVLCCQASGPPNSLSVAVLWQHASWGIPIL
jgi:hypothetical protein